MFRLRESSRNRHTACALPRSVSASQIRQHRRENIGTTGWITPMVVNAGVSARWVFVSRRQRQRPRNARRLQQRRSRKHLHAPSVPVTTGHASAEVAPETNVAAAAAPVYWLDASRLLNQPSTVPPATQQPSLEERSASSPDPSPSADESPAPARSVVASAGDSLPQTVARAEEPQRIVPIAKPATSIVDDDHTFALLLLMFVTLAIAGPMLHYSERRRRRFGQTCSGAAMGAD